MIKPGLYTCFSDFLWFIAAHHQVADYLNTTKESLLMKMAWEMMNPEYKKGMQRKPRAVKKKDPISKTAAPPSKKTSATTSLSNAESEKKKVDDYLNTTKESLLMKMAWKMMNPEYKKGMQRKSRAVKKKDPISKTAAPPSKKTSATTSLSNAESEKKKRLSAYINFDVLDKLFDDVENSVKPSSKDTLASSRPMARNLRGVGDLAEDLSRINDAEVAGYLNTTKESLLMKIAWEMMNPEYKKGTQRKPTTTVKKKDPISKTAAPSKKTSATTTQSNAESEKKKFLLSSCVQRLSAYINLDVLDKLFDDENSPKRTKLEKPVGVGDQVKNSQQRSEEKCLLEPEDFEEEDKPVWNKDYSTEEANGGEDEFYGGADLEYEDQDEAEYNEDIIW
ncbi:hypothetical protein F2Q69_00046909 [Brassica cretica]|uniref:Brf1 TBP-binding domain-containing protein n=1 Tax=Brassica cretica TaxID=69181 RepID=A0A8S9PRS5_BRACR|nr:hypothetical protein F2Q69_00046909 [Brassica cretica]